MGKFAAVYCVYENSGFLAESVRRVYPLMDKILFLLNFQPWNGKGNDKLLLRTYQDILEMFDPYGKFEVVSGYWKTETEQRNYGLQRLRDRGIEWCGIIDDDELYNYTELGSQIHRMKNGSKDVGVYLAPQKIYWKERKYAISNLIDAMPTFCRTDRQVNFCESRAVNVNWGSWYTFQPDELVCHHFSYVRDDEMMKRKIGSFSHARDFTDNRWFNEVWMKWSPEMLNLHPNNDATDSFKQAVPVEQTPYPLEECVISSESELEALLRRCATYKHRSDLSWLRHSDGRLLEFWYKFVSCLLEKKNWGNRSILEVGTQDWVSYFAFCEAVMKTGLEAHVHNANQDGFRPDANRTYQQFSTVNTYQDLHQNYANAEWDVIHVAGTVSGAVIGYVLNHLKKQEKAYLMISCTQSGNAALFNQLKKGKPYYEFKDSGFGIIEFSQGG